MYKLPFSVIDISVLAHRYATDGIGIFARQSFIGLQLIRFKIAQAVYHYTNFLSPFFGGLGSTLMHHSPILIGGAVKMFVSDSEIAVTVGVAAYALIRLSVTAMGKLAKLNTSDGIKSGNAYELLIKMSHNPIYACKRALGQH